MGTILILLFLVIFIHISIEKCLKICNTDTLDHLENQQIDEQFEYIHDSNIFVINVLFFFLRILFNNLRFQILSSIRFNLLLVDSLPILALFTCISNIYYKNPYLRKYVWRNIFNSTSVQPQNGPNGIELQSM